MTEVDDFNAFAIKIYYKRVDTIGNVNMIDPKMDIYGRDRIPRKLSKRGFQHTRGESDERMRF